jgi:pimeloyl-ACP methyl ester carboxylesterase
LSEVTFALIPGGGGDPWEWHRLVPELERRGHRAVAVRLPADDDRAGWAEYADAVVDSAGDARRLVLVAASMGGFTAPIVCTKRPVELLVLANAMVPVPGETFTAWGANTGSGTARRDSHAELGLTPAEAEDDAVIYYHDLPPDVAAEARSRTWQDQSMTPVDEPWPLTRWPDVPTRIMAGRHDRMFPFDFQRRVARERLGLDIDEIEAGHMMALGHPEELADALEGYLGQGR